MEIWDLRIGTFHISYFIFYYLYYYNIFFLSSFLRNGNLKFKNRKNFIFSSTRREKSLFERSWNLEFRVHISFLSFLYRKIINEIKRKKSRDRIWEFKYRKISYFLFHILLFTLLYYFFYIIYHHFWEMEIWDLRIAKFRIFFYVEFGIFRIHISFAFFLYWKIY